MTTRGVRVGARLCAVAGATALLAATPGVAQAEPTYDGSATAVQIDDVTLTLFPADADMPDLLQGMPPPEEQQVSLTEQADLPDRVGYATYEATDEPAALPDNPVINARAFRASSTNVDGTVVSEAAISGLELGGGALSAESITARCVGDGDEITLSAPVAKLEGDQVPDGSRVELTANQSTPIPGVGAITWNQQDTDGTTYGDVSNIVIDLDSNLSLDVLKEIPEAAAEFEDVLTDTLQQARASGADTPLAALTDELPPLDDLSGRPLYEAVDDALEEVPTKDLPDLNSLLAVDGTITLANADCSQGPAGNNPVSTDDDEPARPTGTTTTPTKEPPLADTGAAGGATALTAGGVLALLAGAYALLRARRRG